MEASWHQNRSRNGCYLRIKHFWKNVVFPLEKYSFLRSSGSKLGRSWDKNGSKINVKKDTETERLGNSILIDFWSIWEPSWPPKTEPRRSKIDVEMALKFDQFLKASWNAIFSAQEAPRGASAADRRSGWSRPEATGGGFRRGKTRTSEKKNPEGGSGRMRRPGRRI